MVIISFYLGNIDNDNPCHFYILLRKKHGCQENYKIYVLGPDLKARGLDKNSLITNIEIVDYNKFVKLAVENDKIQNWL